MLAKYERRSGQPWQDRPQAPAGTGRARSGRGQQEERPQPDDATRADRQSSGLGRGRRSLEVAASRSMLRVPRAVFLLIPLALAGGGIGYVRSRPKTVEVVKPVEKTVIESISASGRLRGQIETSVGAQTSGLVRDVFVREGDRVRAGQPIARLDDSVLTVPGDPGAGRGLHRAGDAVAGRGRRSDRARQSRRR